PRRHLGRDRAGNGRRFPKAAGRRSRTRGRPGTRGGPVKQAAVWKGRFVGQWWVDVCDAEHWRPHTLIEERAYMRALAEALSYFPTHAEALSYALAATGQLSDGDPNRPCGRGACCLGDQHHGECRQ